MTERQISFSEASTVSYEEYTAALDTMADALPEVAMRYGELYRRGLELVRKYQLLPSFFESDGRSRLFVGLAGYGETPDDDMPEASGIWAEQHQAIIADDTNFVENVISIIGRHHSTTLQGARDEIDRIYESLHGDMPPEKIREVLEIYTDGERTEAINVYIAENDLFAEQRTLLGKTKEQEVPFKVRVIGLRDDRETDDEARGQLMRAIGLKNFKKMPSGWLVSRQARELCITEEVADTILSHPADAPQNANDGINTLCHEKAHLEYDWRLDGGDIGSALNEIGAEVLSGALPSDWHYKSLLTLMQEYNRSLQPIPESEYEDDGLPPVEPVVYLEELFVNTPDNTDGFAHIITGIARQVGLTGMVQMATHLSSGARSELTDYYHTSISQYLGKPEAPHHFLIPITDTYTPTYATYVSEGAVGAVIASVQDTLARTDNARTQALEGANNLLSAIAHIQAAQGSKDQTHLYETIYAYSRTRTIALHLGKTMLTLQDYIRSIA